SFPAFLLFSSFPYDLFLRLLAHQAITTSSSAHAAPGVAFSCAEHPQPPPPTPPARVPPSGTGVPMKKVIVSVGALVLPAASAATAETVCAPVPRGDASASDQAPSIAASVSPAGAPSSITRTVSDGDAVPSIAASAA